MNQEQANLFVAASREKWRFDSPKGLFNVEDLWDLPLSSRDGRDLDNVAKALHQEIQALGESSFVNPNQNATKRKGLEEKLELVKLVIGIRQAEDKAKRDKAAIEAEIKRTEQLLASKKDEALGNLSVEELEARLAALRLNTQ